MREEIRDLQQELGITSLRDPRPGRGHGHFRSGGLDEQGQDRAKRQPRDLYTKPNSRFVADFIGRANFLDGSYNGQSTNVAGYESRPAAGPTGKVIVMVRPGSHSS